MPIDSVTSASVQNAAHAGAQTAPRAPDPSPVVAALNQPGPTAAPGSIAPATGEIASQLLKGNPGGVGVGFGLGGVFDSGA